MPTAEEQRIRQVMAHIAAGDRTAFTQLYNEYSELIYSVAFYFARSREAAEDAVQFIFLKVWERSSELAQMENPLGWMRNAAKFHIINAFKKRVAEIQRNQSLYIETEENDPFHQLVNKQQMEIIASVIDSLPERQREVYKLSREQGYTYAEVAEQLQIGRETVKEHLSRALKTIRLALLQQGGPLLVLLWRLLNI